MKKGSGLSSAYSPRSWGCIAITLDPQGARYKNFLKNNNHLTVETFQGVKGTELSKQEIVSQGLATNDLVLSPLMTHGTIGCAASHRSIWDRSTSEGRGYFILEDDCYTHPKIIDFINQNVEFLMSIDICFFGINTDSILETLSPTGLVRLSLFDPKHPSEEWIKYAISKTNIQQVAMHKLIKAFGFCAYFISPNGAERLKTKTFPLSLETTNIPLITDKMPRVSIDRAANGEYSKLKAFVCQPFLAYTPNTDSQTKK